MVTECGRQQSTVAVLCETFMWQIVKTSVIRLWVTEGPNAYDQIAFNAFNSFLVEVQTNAGYIMQCMHNNNLVIRIAGSSCSRNKQDYLDQPNRAPNLRQPRRPAQFLEADALIKEFKTRLPAVNIVILL